MEFEKAPFAYPYDSTDGREDPEAGPDIRRVVRGGAWYAVQVGTRTVGRNVGHPDNRYGELGFRVVVSSPSLPEPAGP